MSPEVIIVGGMVVKLLVFGGVAFAVIISQEYFGTMDLKSLKKKDKDGDLDAISNLRQKSRQSS